ncbi:ABC transporter permease [Ruania zhangjianzhongii]|uniref:ABC transporter permease n=1 Tax=Ruania zhangjianzhongii TaxID=2603206 RepID=UPI0011C89D56|nr:ribose ABC transporter permease [Ruania zhangjianzhongii]
MTDGTVHSGPGPEAPPETSRIAWLLKQGLRIWETWGIGVVLVLLVALMSFIAPHFFSLSNLFNIARSTSIIAVLAAGMTVVILIAGIDLSVGSVLAVSGVISVIGWNAGLPAVVAVLLGVIVGALAGMLNGMLVAYLSLAGFIVTLAGLTAYRGVAYALTDGRPLTAEGTLGFHLLGDGNFIGVPIPVWIMIATYAILWFLLERTTFGKHVYAAGGNAEAARMAGLRTNLIFASAYAISGVTAGIAGVMFMARVQSGQPTAGEGYELQAIAAVVLGGTSLMGGRGRVLSTLVGALIIGVLTNGMVLMNTPFFTQLIVQGVVIVLAVSIDRLRVRYVK